MTGFLGVCDQTLFFVIECCQLRERGAILFTDRSAAAEIEFFVALAGLGFGLEAASKIFADLFFGDRVLVVADPAAIG